MPCFLAYKFIQTICYNRISSGVVDLNKYPDEYQKLRDNPELIPNMVAEMQLRVLWEEIMKRFHKVEVVGAVECNPNTLARS